MDRFSIGLPDAQEEVVHIYTCGYSKCGEDIISGDDLWELDGGLYCSAECAVKELGGERVVAD